MPGERGVRGLSGTDAEIDELYANAPDTFTKKRDELAKRLKADGKTDVAAQVKALRKPTQIAYVLNQVARRFADEVGELVDVGRELARAQRKALRGGDASDELRTAIGRQREVVRDLTTKSGGLMREIGVTATGHLDEIAGALQAALVDPIVGAQLEEGRLEKVPEPATGFPGAAPGPELKLVPPPPTSAPREKTAREKARDKAADKKALAREKAAEKKALARERVEEKKARARQKAEEKARAKLEAARSKREAARTKAEAKAAALEERRLAQVERARVAAEDARSRAATLVAEAEEARKTAEALRAEAERLVKEAKKTEHAADAADAKATKSEKTAKAAQREAARLATKARAK